MPTSATGTSATEPARTLRGAPRASERGFTFIEILVVVAIIALLTAGLLLSVSLTGRDPPLEKEGERLLALFDYAREQAELQTREYGVLFTDEGYEFVAYDPRRDAWGSVPDDDALRARRLPEGLGVKLTIEARPVLLTRPKDDKDRKPQVMIFSNGDLTSFAATIEREGGARSITVTQDDKGAIVEQPMVEARP